VFGTTAVGSRRTPSPFAGCEESEAVGVYLESKVNFHGLCLWPAVSQERKAVHEVTTVSGCKREYWPHQSSADPCSVTLHVTRLGA